MTQTTSSQVDGVRSPLATPPEETPGHGLLLGRKVVVTAAAGTGIGFATARRALLEGADVVLSDWHERRPVSYTHLTLPTKRIV